MKRSKARKTTVVDSAISDAPTSQTQSVTPDNAVPVEIDGESYNLCFEYSALASAEIHFRRQGHLANLLFNLPQSTLDSLRSVFPCLVHQFHPDLTWERAQELVTLNSAYPIAIAISQAFDRAEGKVAAQEVDSSASPTA